MATIARGTGWSEHFIRWQLPLSRGWAYFHAQRLHEGERPTWPDAIVAQENWFDDIRKKYEAR